MSKSLPIHDDLIRIARGEAMTDSWNRTAYSVDASQYEVMPEAVVCPIDTEDVQRVCEYCWSKKLAMGARGAGTGLLGQSLCSGVVLDFTKHMNRTIEIGEDYVITQPGIVKAVLDRELGKKGKYLPPDPASSNYCTIGGMIANNSSGIHCLGHGNTIDFLDGVRAVYSDGSIGYADDNKYDSSLEKLGRLLQPHQDLISNGYPQVSKNSCGYRLDSVISKGKFHPHKVFAASEGTLGLLTEAKLRILDMPEHRSLLVLGFSELITAISAVPMILRFSPVALEMMDHTVVSGENRGKDSGCILFVEFEGSKAIADKNLRNCIDKLASICTVLEYASDESSLARIWGARKAALSNIMRLTVGSRKPIGLIEDTVVRPDNLSEHINGLLQEYRSSKLEYVIYGHVGDGNVHTRPVVDLDSPSQMQMVERLAKSVFERVVKFGGTITGEHGDGIARRPYIEMVYGKRIPQIFEQVKELFDSRHVLNPGKKVASKLLR